VTGRPKACDLRSRGDGRRSAEVCYDCWALPWFADGRHILFNSPGFIKAFDTESPQTMEVLRIFQPYFRAAPLVGRPLDRVLTHCWTPSTLGIFCRTDPQRRGDRGIGVHRGERRHDVRPNTEFSPDGQVLYFLSGSAMARDACGHMRLDPATKRPLASLSRYSIFTAHGVSPLFVKAGQRRFPFARDKIVITMDEACGQRLDVGFRRQIALAVRTGSGNLDRISHAPFQTHSARRNILASSK